MMSTRGRSVCAMRAAAAPSASASSAVSSSPAAPRTPSVPNSLRATAPLAALRAGLALGELRALARLLQAGLLALLGARVAREKAPALQLAAEVRVGLEQRARDAVAQRPGLGRDAAAVQSRDDVHALVVANGLERLADVALQGEAREVLLERAPVDEVGAAAGP